MKEKIKNFICENLGVDERALEFDTPLFEGTAVGLDSIDSIEIISFVDEEFGVSMAGVSKEHFRSINTIADYIIANK